MGNEDDYISDEALDRLGRLLLDRIDQDIDLDGKDEGVFLLSGLDGFFAAIVSGPEIIFPAQWLPSIWGDFEPEWESHEEAEETITLLIDIMNSIAGALLEAPEDFEPMFYESFHEGDDFTSVEEWCIGYMRGVNLTASQWQEGGEDMLALLATIKAFGDLDSMVSLKDISEEEVNNIPADMRNIHAFWLERRSEYDPVATPFFNESAYVGRNDPCPCGSGKRYKKCCLH